MQCYKGQTAAGMTNKLTPEKVDGQTRIVASKNQVSCDLNEEVVLLEMQEGIYYSLSPVAARIWSLIQEPKTLNAIQEALLQEYDVTPDRCEQDLLALLKELRKYNLVEIVHEAVP
jgi:hypothetical protein